MLLHSSLDIPEQSCCAITLDRLSRDRLLLECAMNIDCLADILLASRAEITRLQHSYSKHYVPFGRMRTYVDSTGYYTLLRYNDDQRGRARIS